MHHDLKKNPLPQVCKLVPFFLSILARMRGSRDLCVTPLLLADGILSRTIYSSSLVTRAGLQDFSKQPKSTRLCEKETICFNASPKSYESILKEQKAMKLMFEILIPLSIFKTNRGCISNLYAPRFEKNPLPQVCKLVPFFLSILARMRGSRDLCVTPLLLADGILSRTEGNEANV